MNAELKRGTNEIKDFWSNTITQKSWEILLSLKKLPFDFILIGGWAAYLWTRAHKSKDIDIIISDFKALDYLKQNYDLRKNEHLRKYEIKIGEIDIDIYLAFFSKFVIPIEDLKDYSTKIEGINVVIPEAFLILKQAAEIDRRGSIKGNKDAIDILALLLNTKINFVLYRSLLKKYKLNHMLNDLVQLIRAFDSGNLLYLGLNPREFKLKKENLLRQLNSRPPSS